MFFSGEQSSFILKNRKMSFSFSNSVFQNTKSVSFGFQEADGGSFAFTATGNKIYDPEGRYVYSYSVDKPISISGDLSGDRYRYYINEETVCLLGRRRDIDIEKICVNVESGQFYSDVRLNSLPIDIQVSGPERMTHGENYVINIRNNSPYEIDIKNCEFSFSPSGPTLEGGLSAKIASGASLNATFISGGDIVEGDVDVEMALFSTAGGLKRYLRAKMALAPKDYHSVNVTFEDGSSSFPFSGELLNGKFAWGQLGGSINKEVSYIALNPDELPIEKNITVILKGVSPVEGKEYSNYTITGVGVSQVTPYTFAWQYPPVVFSKQYYYENVELTIPFSGLGLINELGYITGAIIHNPGSGFSASLPPILMTYGSPVNIANPNAELIISVGEVFAETDTSIKKYNFLDHWDIFTGDDTESMRGFAKNNLISNGGFLSSTTLAAGDDTFLVRFDVKNAETAIPFTAEFILSGDGDVRKENINITTTFSKDFNAFKIQEAKAAAINQAEMDALYYNRILGIGENGESVGSGGGFGEDPEDDPYSFPPGV